MTNTFQAPVVKAQMLIRKPVAQVFEALVDPARHPLLPARSFGGQLIELVQWLPSTRDPRAVPDASVIRKSSAITPRALSEVASRSPNMPSSQVRSRSHGMTDHLPVCGLW